MDPEQRDYLESLITEREAAEFLGFAPRTLSKWRAMGNGPDFYRANGWWIRYRRKDLLDWAKPQEYSPTPLYAVPVTAVCAGPPQATFVR